MASEYSAASQQLTELSPERTVEPIPNRAPENSSSDAPISSEDPGLGKLSRLPGEIRNMIWREFLSKTHNETSEVQCTDSRNTKLAVLRTSRRIYIEVGSYIYPRARRPFIISVSPEYRYKSWITLSNGKKNATTWNLGSLKEAEARGFLNMGRHRNTFRVEIEAPDRGDAGQFICIFWKVRKVADMLQRCVRSSRGVQIIFKDGKMGKWFLNGKPTTTNIDLLPCPPDYYSVLLPFFQLKNVDHPVVKIPEDVNIEPRVFELFETVIKMMKRKTPCGLDETTYCRFDVRTGQKLGSYSCRCMKATSRIFRLQSWTAMMLRIENFLDKYRTEELVSKDVEEKMKRVLKQQQYVQTERRHLLWTIHDDKMIADVKYEEDERLRRARLADYQYDTDYLYDN
ncbi:hypothetical protein BGZ60DRAFT_527037 [Tricladium varicosporioides]|nr:hypothetical protein BGZ60DRAFT_527037 [Hymenoscyphus varicosporioides]